MRIRSPDGAQRNPGNFRAAGTAPDFAALIRATKRGSMPGMDLLHRGQLLWGGRALMFRLPLLIGHAVDRLAALVLADGDPLGVGLFLHPVGEAVAAEAGQ